MQTFPIAPQSLPTGDTFIAAQPIPVGTSKGVLNLDVTNMVPGQQIDFLVEHFNGTDWLAATSNTTGPWRDKQSVLHNDVALNFSFGAVNDGTGNMVPILSKAGWLVRAKLTVTNGPIAIGGGSLVVS